MGHLKVLELLVVVVIVLWFRHFLRLPVFILNLPWNRCEHLNLMFWSTIMWLHNILFFQFESPLRLIILNNSPFLPKFLIIRLRFLLKPNDIAFKHSPHVFRVDFLEIRYMFYIFIYFFYDIFGLIPCFKFHEVLLELVPGDVIIL